MTVKTQSNPKAPVVKLKNGFYRPAQRMEWIESEDEATAGLKILVRTSITNAEQRELRAKHQAIATYADEVWDKLPFDKQDLADSPQARELALLAPYIHDWNVTATTPDGDVIEVAPPVVNGPEAFDVTGPDEQRWMVQTVLIGYGATGKAIAWRRRSKRGGDTSDPATTPETPSENPSSPPPS
jgi:hypothetical protein